MSELRIGSLCSGYGGLDSAVQQVLGGDLAWVADSDPGAAAILAHRHPDTPNLGDITTADWGAVPPVDVLAAGFPCQPVSNAGLRLGAADDRWIWPAVAHAVRVLRPGLVVLENVAALAVRGLGAVLADLAALGLDTEWTCVRASDIGAPHRRERLFLLAWPADAPGPGLEARREGLLGGGAAADAAHQRHERPGGARRRRPGPTDGGDVAADAAGGGRGGHPHVGEQPSEVRRGPDADGRAVWGRYAPAIHRWETALGRPAPAPTEPGRTGQPRLSPAFVEWLMGLGAGWVTDVPGLTRNQMLRALGNGVVPAQAAAAIRLLLDRATP